MATLETLWLQQFGPPPSLDHHLFRQQRFTEHTVCWSKHKVHNNKQNRQYSLPSCSSHSWVLFIVNYVPDIILRTSPILPHLSQLCMVFHVLQRKKLRLGDIRWYAQGHLNDKKSISDRAEFQHKPITTVLFFLLSGLLYLITPSYLSNTFT